MYLFTKRCDRKGTNVTFKRFAAESCLDFMHWQSKTFALLIHVSAIHMEEIPILLINLH